MTDHLYPPPTTTSAAASSSPGKSFQCSFCKADDGRRLVRGAVGVFICCECVVLAGNLFEEDEMDKRASVPRWTSGGCWSMPQLDAFGNLLSPENYFNDVLQALGE